MYSDTIFKLFSNQRLVFIITLLLTLPLAYQLSILIWKFVPQPVIEEREIPVVPRAGNDVAQRELTAQQKSAQIASQQLFGSALQAPIKQAAAVRDAPTSTLKYKLRGIYYSQDQALASVILQKDANNNKFYRLGDEVDRDIFIDRIQADHILISRNGRIEKLVLEKPTADLSGKAQKSALANLSSAPSSRVLKNYRRRYKDNPMALAKRFQAIPVSENGQNIGYKLKALRGERLLQKLNLQKDDVFLEINGIGLNKPFQALDALKSLTTAESVALTILRNGNRETLDFNLQ